MDNFKNYYQKPTLVSLRRYYRKQNMVMTKNRYMKKLGIERLTWRSDKSWPFRHAWSAYDVTRTSFNLESRTEVKIFVGRPRFSMFKNTYTCKCLV